MYLSRLFSLENPHFVAVVPYHGVYDLRLVAISVLIAILAAFVALSLSDRIAAAPSRNARLAWTSAGALSMGCGIWAMHFIGMLAFSLPCGVAYDPVETMVSMIPGVIASGIALVLISRKGEVDLMRLFAGAALMGIGIGAMHYMGMAAMRPDALLLYNPLLVAVSVVVAILLAGTALCIRLILRDWGMPQRYATLLSAIIMGAAIAGMHYTAMQAALFYPAQNIVLPALALPSTGTAILIALFAGLIAAIALIGSFAGRQSELAATMAAEARRRETLEREAQEGRLRLQTIFDAVADAIVTVDRAGLIREWSSGAARIFGYAADEVIGREAGMLMSARDRRPWWGRPEEFPTGNASRELAALRKDGSEFPIELTMGEARNGDEVFFTAIMRDITLRKKAQQEIIRAREAAEEAARVKTNFLATMTHEIRTPLNGVLGMANLLTATPLTGRQKHLVDSLTRSGQALLALISDVLDFSKIEAGRLELFAVEFSPREIVAEITDMFRELCARKGIEFVYFVAEEVPSRLRGDPVRLRQILINLVGNAFKFTERGGILVEVAVEAGPADAATLRFAVQDTGIGIAPENQARIFESFQQVDASMSRARGGTGLGLAISRQLVEMMGGRLELESELGTGSRFHFAIRCDRVAAPEHELHRPRRVTRPLRSLVVDASALSSNVLALYLAAWQIDATLTATVAAAEAVLAENRAEGRRFDAAILDIKGLGAAGIELARRLRAAAPETRLILMIGLDPGLADDQLDRLDAFAILTKPVRPSTLFDCLAAIAAGEAASGIAPFFLRRAPAEAAFRFDARILLVEDNPVNQEVATGILENMHCRVVAAATGVQALRLLAQEKFDLVLMDCEMPEMDGFEATRRLRQREASAAGMPQPRVPVIALTAHALADIREKCLAAGMDDFLVKPFDERQMGETLARFLAPGAADPAAAAIDRTVIAGMRSFKGENGRTLLRRVVGQFAATAPGLARTIRNAAGAGDAEALWRAAHSLKSTAAALGAARLSRRCAAIEKGAREEGVAPDAALMAELEAEIDAATGGLHEILADVA